MNKASLVKALVSLGIEVKNGKVKKPDLSKAVATDIPKYEVTYVTKAEAPEAMYYATYLEKNVAKDNYENGQDTELKTTMSEKINLKAASLQELVSKVSKEYGLPGKVSDYMAWEGGILIANLLENEQGHEVEEGSKEFESFKKGEVDLWAATYNVFIEKGSVAPVSEDELKEAGAESYD